jgi:type IV pilus assembly protein PilC
MATTFSFKAVDPGGSPSRGEVDADSRQVVAEQLKSRGLIVVDISEKQASKEISLRRKRVKTGDLTIMTRQLSTMVSSGMTLLRALTVLEQQTESAMLKETLVTVRKDVESGVSFSDAIERQPKVFNPLYVAMVRAGETGGVLEGSLIRIADQLESDESLRRQVKSAMMYPSVIMIFAAMVLLGLVAFLVPVFVKTFEELDGELPGITKITVAMSDFVTGRWYLLIVMVVGSVTGFRRWRTSSWGRPQWDRIRLKIPMKIGEVVQKVALARWARTFSALISSGVPILQAIDITGQTAGNDVVEKAMADVTRSVKSGGMISTPLRDSPVFPAMVVQMIAVGEETGALDSMLSKIADFYEDQVNAAVKALTSIIEPVMIVIVGAIVGFIVIAMYMPMFQVYDKIQ